MMSDDISRDDGDGRSQRDGDQPERDGSYVAPSLPPLVQLNMNGEEPSPISKLTDLRAFTLIRKKVTLGYVYFLEERSKNRLGLDPGKYGLYGGTIEQVPELDKTNSFERPKTAAARELQEEIGIGFKPNQLKEIFFGTSYREGGNEFKAYTFVVHESATDKVSCERIRKHQRDVRIEDRQAARQITELKASQSPNKRAQIKKLQETRKHLADKLSAGPPIKIRFFLGHLWFVPWRELTPLAAQALLADITSLKLDRADPPLSY